MPDAMAGAATAVRRAELSPALLRFEGRLGAAACVTMAVFLGARLMVRYADKYDPDLASAFEKLELSGVDGGHRRVLSVLAFLEG